MVELPGLVISMWLLIASSVVLLCTSYFDWSAELVWFLLFVGTGTALVLRQRLPDNHAIPVFSIPRRFGHFVFGVIQAGLTSLIAAGIASFPSSTLMAFLIHWLSSWLVAWLAMLPVVVLAAPAIRAISVALTRED